MALSVARFCVTAVKSTALHHPETVRLEPYGVVDNRAFYIADPDGRLVNNTKHGPLMAIHAAFQRAHGTEWLSLRFPDGSVVEGDTTAIGGEVHTDFYGRTVIGDRVVGGFAEAISAFADRPLLLVRPRRAGDGNDGFPVSMASTASSQELARRSGSDRALDSRRFRMLIEITGCSPHQEDQWIGRRVRVGEAVVQVAEAVARCVITTLDPDTGRKDLDTLAAIKAYRGQADGRHIDFGVYASVIEPGTIRVGDPVEPRPA